MSELSVRELRVFVPAKDFELSKRFYRDVGFTMTSDAGDVAAFGHESNPAVAFLLQRFYVKELAENLMLSMLVDDVDAWWADLQAKGVIEKYGVRSEAPAERPWGHRDFVLIDPTGVLWRIGQLPA